MLAWTRVRALPKDSHETGVNSRVRVSPAVYDRVVPGWWIPDRMARKLHARSPAGLSDSRRFASEGVEMMDAHVSRMMSMGVVLCCGLAVSSRGQEQMRSFTAADCTSAGCHKSVVEHKVMHAPAESDECSSCHESVDEKEHTFKFVAAGKALCEECHDDVTEEHTYAHGPAAGGGCTTCHDPHGSDHDKLLTYVVPELCTRCHYSVWESISKSEHVHSPAEEDCLVCHQPHGANDKMMLVRSRPGLCFDCHDDLTELAESSGVKHGAVACNRSCTYCHDPHAGKVQHVLRDEPMALCLSCHDKEIDSAHGKVPNIAKILEENEYDHGPIKEKKCAPCHAHVHGGSSFRLLARDYPPEFYTSFAESEYALCFGCHDAKAMTEERTTKVTAFRNGDHNLHYVHVDRSRKSRSCRACHNSHASDNPKHLTKSVRFGRMGWQLPLNCALNEKGGTCAPGCHKPYGYDRETPIVNLPTPPEAGPVNSPTPPEPKP